jgi:hypothetical protein
VGDVKKIYQNPNVRASLIVLIERFKAGSPTDSTNFWVSKKPKEVAQIFNDENQTTISNGAVKRLLKELGYGYRKQSKQLATGTYEQRNEQFEIITQLMLIMSIKSPLISIDCKKNRTAEAGAIG